MAVRAGVRVLLTDDPDIQVVAEASSLAEMVASPPDADVVIWSPAPYIDLDSLQLELSNIQPGDTAGVLLIYDDPKIMGQLSGLPMKAWGILDTESTQAELVAGIHAVNEGLVVASPVWLNRALSHQNSNIDENHEMVEVLTEREIEILQLLAYGLTNKQIAARLKISAHTVKFHVSTIYNKMGTTNRVETVNRGLKKGLIVV